MRNINELIGIIQGINFDGVINEKETMRLKSWVDINRDLAIEHQHKELIKLVDDILEDKIITNEEREILIEYSEKFQKENSDKNSRLYELNGIIEGIICDGEINDSEIYRLKEWMDIYGGSIRKHKIMEGLSEIIDEILEDGIITFDEQQKLLNMLSAKIGESQIKIKLDYLRKQVKEKKNIGIDLIDILDNENTLKEIHFRAESQLASVLNSYSGGYPKDSEIVVISLVLIAMLDYNGNYYGNVEKTYVELYNKFSNQKIEGMIRSILNRYRTNEEIASRNRIIDVVLSNSIVPRNFLGAFFEFIYDIYKLNFDYDLPEDPYDDFKFVYEGLRNKMSSDGDDIQLNVTQKTYKLIQSTKKLIAEAKYLDSVIQLSTIVAKLIDNRIWNKNLITNNSYLAKGFERWASTIEADDKRDGSLRSKSQMRSRWEPKLILDGNQVYLLPPIHKIKSRYNYWDIRVVVTNGDQIIYENSQPDIREIIGGYQVSFEKIKLVKPLSQLNYRLMAGDETIYDSKDKLYRNLIVFNSDRYEIKNNTDYEGMVIFCYYNNHEKITPFYESENYKLANQNIKYEDVYFIEETIFNFSSLEKPGVFGEKFEGHYLVRQDDGLKINIYKSLSFLVFESTNCSAQHDIEINGIKKKLTDFHNTVIEKTGVLKYIVDFDIKDAGIYFISVNQIIDGKNSRLFNFEVAYDPGLKIDELKLDDKTYMVSVKTDLNVNPLNHDINIYDFNENDIKFEYKRSVYSYCIPFSFDIYRINNGNWIPMSDDIWIDDISNDSVLDIYGKGIDGLVIYSNKGNILQDEIKLKNYDVFSKVAIGFIASYKTSYDYLMLVLTSNGRVHKTIFCYNKCILNEDETELFFDSHSSSLVVTAKFHGKGNVFFEVTNIDDETLYKSGFLQNGDTEKVSNLSSFQKYNICFYEKPKGLSLNKYNFLKKYEKVLYARDEFINRSFKIDEVYFNQTIRGDFVEKSYRFNKMFVNFSEKLSDDLFLGEIIVKSESGNFKLENINPVEIEICSEVIDNTMDLYITNERDGLLMDFEHHGIMNTLDDKKAPDIFLYTIDMNGVKIS